MSEQAMIIKRLEAQLEVSQTKLKECRASNHTLKVKASKWQLAKAAGVQFAQIKALTDSMPLEGFTLGSLTNFSEIKKIVDEFVETYGKEL